MQKALLEHLFALRRHLLQRNGVFTGLLLTGKRLRNGIQYRCAEHGDRTLHGFIQRDGRFQPKSFRRHIVGNHQKDGVIHQRGSDAEERLQLVLNVLGKAIQHFFLKRPVRLTLGKAKLHQLQKAVFKRL